MKQRLLLGAHISIAGGLDQAIVRGKSIGCTTIQIFVKSNRQWAARPLSQEEITQFKQTATQANIHPIVAHAAYLINLGSPDEIVVQKSIDSFTTELMRCQYLGIPYLVVHPGSSLGTNGQTCITTIANNLNQILATTNSSTMVLLETTAGQGANIGYTFEQLAAIYHKIINKEQVGICFDTCHAWAAGYDFSTPARYAKLWHHFDDAIGIEHLKVMHLNDSKNLCGSRIDRHEDIGKGKLGLEPFRLIMNDERLFAIPKIIETPKNTLADDTRNMRTLINLLTPETQKRLIIPQ